MEHRRAAAARAFARAGRLGIKIDDDPVFAELIERWVSGEVTMAEARQVYLDHIRERERVRTNLRALSIEAWNAQYRKVNE